MDNFDQLDAAAGVELGDEEDEDDVEDVLELDDDPESEELDDDVDEVDEELSLLLELLLDDDESRLSVR